MYPKITKVAKYLPPRRVTNSELSAKIETTDEWIRSRTGIEERRIAETLMTSDLAIEVARQLIKEDEVASLDFIIVATMTADFSTPSVACLVQGAIGATKAFAFDINAACSGFVYALSTAEKFILSGQYQKGLVIGAEKMSSIIDWQDRKTAVLFGDGAAGIVLENKSNEPSFLGEALVADGGRAHSLVARKNNHGFDPIEDLEKQQEFLMMDGKKIFDFVIRDVSQQISEVLKEEPDVDYILAHQANERLLDALAKKTKISRLKFLSNVSHYGNTSAASIPLLLADQVEKGTLVLGSHQKVLLTGFGGGLTWGSLLIKL